MVRKQNERTLLLQYRIIPLSLHTNIIISLVLAPRPHSPTRLGAFLFPETFSHKFFPKFFPIRPRRLFSVFLVRKIMGTKHSFRSPTGGGCPSFIPALCPLSLLPLWSPLYLSSIQKARIWIYFGMALCFLGKIGDSEERKPNKCLVLVWLYALWVPFLCCYRRSYPTGLVGWAVCSVLHQGKNRQKQAILKKILTVLCVFSGFYDTTSGKSKELIYRLSIFAALSVIIKARQCAPVLTLCSWYISTVVLPMCSVLLCGFVTLSTIQLCLYMPLFRVLSGCKGVYILDGICALLALLAYLACERLCGFGAWDVLLLFFFFLLLLFFFFFALLLVSLSLFIALFIACFKLIF